VWEDINGYKYAETLYDPGADKFLTKAEYLEMRVADPGFFIVVYMPPRKE
jgi:N-acyl-D-amino-acid deacylase